MGYGVGVAAEVGVNIDPDANISDMNGGAISVGGSGTIAGVSVGGDISTSLDGKQSEISGNIGVSVGSVGEGHMYTTATKAVSLTESDIKDGLQEISDKVQTGEAFGIPAFLRPVI